MGLFQKRHSDEQSRTSEPSHTPQSLTITDADLERCSALLQEIETAIDLDEPRRGNDLAYQLALAGGYPSLQGRALFTARMEADLKAGQPGASIIDKMPWNWLTAVASTAYDQGNILLAARLGWFSAFWRMHWKDQLARLAPGRSLDPATWPPNLNIQFSEEIGLIPPPDEAYSQILSTAIRALSSLDNGDILRHNSNRDDWTVPGALMLISRELLDLEKAGMPIDADVRTLAAEKLS